MNNESITFACSSCGIKLTVPASLAGVIGPCPACDAQIQSPEISPSAPVPVLNPPALPENQTSPASAASVEQRVKPEARPLPQQAAPVEVITEPAPEPTASSSDLQPSCLARFMMLLVLCALALALVYGVQTFLKNQEAPQSSPQVKPTAPASIKQILATPDRTPVKAPENPASVPPSPAP